MMKTKIKMAMRKMMKMVMMMKMKTTMKIKTKMMMIRAVQRRKETVTTHHMSFIQG